MNTTIELFILAVMIGLISCPVLLLLSGDRSDIIDVKSLGINMCSAHNLSYDYRELIILNGTFTNIPIIYCKNTTNIITYESLIIEKR